MEKYVLLIEDDPFLQKAYEMKFSLKGVPFRLVGDGREMMQILKENTIERPAAVVLDLLLPYVGGFEILEEMRRTKGWEAMPVIIVSNVKDAGGIQKAESLGVKNYFIKTGMKLDDAVEKILSYF